MTPNSAFAFAALVVIPLAQVPLVAYLSRYVELDAGEEVASPTRGYVTYGTVSARPDDTVREDVCPHCGSDITGEYDYCGQCAGRVTGAHGRKR